MNKKSVIVVEADKNLHRPVNEADVPHYPNYLRKCTTYTAGASSPAFLASFLAELQFPSAVLCECVTVQL